MDCTGQVGFWRYPGHVRKCKLAAENILEIACARARARVRRQEVLALTGWTALACGAGVILALVAYELTK